MGCCAAHQSGAGRWGLRLSLFAYLARLHCSNYMVVQVNASKGKRMWPVQDAKARFSELLDTCLTDGPQLVTRRGAETAVLVSVREWQRLQHAGRPILNSLLLSDEARGDIPLLTRGGDSQRAPADLS